MKQLIKAAIGAALVGLEIGLGQAEATAALARDAGFPHTEIRNDLEKQETR